MFAIFLRQLCNNKISAILAFEILLKDCLPWKICNLSKILSKNYWSNWSELWIFTKL